MGQEVTFGSVTLRQYPVLHAILEALDWNQSLSPEVKTIWEHFPGANDAMAIGPVITRAQTGQFSVMPLLLLEDIGVCFSRLVDLGSRCR